MTIKEKLISLDIDVDKKKDLVEEVKKELNKVGENGGCRRRLNINLTNGSGYMKPVT